MEIEHLISYLFQVKGYLEGGEKTLMTEPIDEIIRCLKEGKNCKAMWEEIKKKYGSIYYCHPIQNERFCKGNETTLCLSETMNELEQKYFPKTVKKTITIEIEAKDGKIINDQFKSFADQLYKNRDSIGYKIEWKECD